MTFDPQAAFANLAEQEKTKGHHSPEGRAIRTLSRALSGWSAATLSARDVAVLCNQAMEDWLKARLKIPAWSFPPMAELLTAGVSGKLMARSEAVRLQRLHRSASRAAHAPALTVEEVNSVLDLCIRLVEKHW